MQMSFPLKVDFEGGLPVAGGGRLNFEIHPNSPLRKCMVSTPKPSLFQPIPYGESTLG